MNVEIDDIFKINENLKKLAKENLGIEAEINILKDEISHDENDIKIYILEEKNRDGKPLYSNEILRKKEFDERIKNSKTFLKKIADLKKFEETEKENKIELNYLLEDLRNRRLYLKITNGIKE